jgi:hypothetical protein
MAIAKAVKHTPWGSLVTFSQTSGANAAQTCSTDSGQAYRILYATITYSASPTQTGVIVTLNSGIAAANDTALQTGSANVQNTHYQPTSPLIINAADAIDVLAPAAGGAITSSVAIYCLTDDG